MKIRIIALTAVLFIPMVLCLSFDSRAQSRKTSPTPTAAPTSSPKPSDEEVIKVTTELVTLTATVTDKNGRYRADLKQSDFTVYEDGAKQELAYFNTGDRVPISLGIVFDTSGSMEDKIEGVRDAVEHFVKNVSPNDEIFLIQFNDDAELAQDFTNDKKRILRAVESLNPRGSTALYDAITLGLQKIRQGKNKKRALLLLTDGNDMASATDLQTALSLAKKSETIIYALGIGHGREGNVHSGILSQLPDTVDMRVLRSFADTTGGNAYYLEEAHEGGRDRVDEAAEEVAAELKQQYTLGYYPTNQKKDGGFRQIVVEAKDKSLRVRTKRGYYSADSGRAGGDFNIFKQNAGQTR